MAIRQTPEPATLISENIPLQDQSIDLTLFQSEIFKTDADGNSPILNLLEQLTLEQSSRKRWTDLTRQHQIEFIKNSILYGDQTLTLMQQVNQSMSAYVAKNRDWFYTVVGNCTEQDSIFFQLMIRSFVAVFPFHSQIWGNVTQQTFQEVVIPKENDTLTEVTDYMLQQIYGFGLSDTNLTVQEVFNKLYISSRRSQVGHVAPVKAAALFQEELLEEEQNQANDEQVTLQEQPQASSFLQQDPPGPGQLSEPSYFPSPNRSEEVPVPPPARASNPVGYSEGVLDTLPANMNAYDVIIANRNAVNYVMLDRNLQVEWHNVFYKNYRTRLFDNNENWNKFNNIMTSVVKNPRFRPKCVPLETWMD